MSAQTYLMGLLKTLKEIKDELVESNHLNARRNAYLNDIADTMRKKEERSR